MSASTAGGGAQPGPVLRTALSLVLARPWANIALGSAIVVSLASVCCGLGLLTTPWFMCELSAMHLSQLRNHEVPRRLEWVWASGVQMGAVLLVSLVGSLAIVGLSPDLPGAPAAGPEQSAVLADVMQSGGFYALLASAATLTVTLPFLFVPQFLIEGRIGPLRAFIASVATVGRGGLPVHLGISLLAHAVQIAPVLLAALVAALWVDLDAAPLSVLVAVPLLAVTVPVGQAMVCAAYVASSPTDASLEAMPRPSRSLTAVWALLLSLPLLCLFLVATALIRPSTLQLGHAQGTEVGVWRSGQGGAVLSIVDTALSIECASAGVVVEASDGGGAGRLPMASPAPIDAVRIVRRRDAYGIELVQGAQRSVAWIDRAGVRLDDDLRRRLLSRVPPSLWLGLGALLVLTAGTARAALAGLFAPGSDVGPARRRGWLCAAVLLPLAAYTLVLSVGVALGL